jgi:hypothetical protein
MAQMGRQWTVVLLALALMGCARSIVTDLDSDSFRPDGIEATQQGQQLQPEVKPPDLAPVAKINKSSRMQANREKLIKKLVEMEVFQKTETTGGVPRLWVGTKFRALEPALKEVYVSVYAQYAGDENVAGPVRLYDGKSRTEIGRYSASDGLKIF